MRNFLALITSLLMFCQMVSAQTRTFSGKVLFDDGEPLAGAYVLAESSTGERFGATTDINGDFTLAGVPMDTREVTISFLGMAPLKVPITNDMHIVMHPDFNILDESLVVAYETVKKSSYSGSAVMVRQNQLENQPLVNFESAITGKVSGVQVTSSTGQIGEVSNIRIRGIGSMNAGNEPLYVVDGVPVISGNVGQMDMDVTMNTTNNAMNTLNIDDIESISVLKDAAAASLFGSRAANGVILITTKSGRKGRPLVEFKAAIGISPSWAYNSYEPASVQENINMLYTVFYDYAYGNKRTYGGATYDGSAAGANGYALAQINGRFNKHGYSFSTSGTGKYEDIIIGEYGNSGRGNGKYFDWNKAFFGTGVYKNIDMSVSGANDKTNYYTSISYTSEQSRLKINKFRRMAGRINLSRKINNWMEIGTNASMGMTIKHGYNDSRNTASNTFMNVSNLLWGFYWPTHYEDGSDWKERYGSWAQNFLYQDTQWENSSINTRMSVIETLTLHLMPGLDWKTKLSFDQNLVQDHLYYSAEHPYATSDNGLVREMRTVYQKMLISTMGNYNKTFGLHKLGLMGGFEAERNKTDYTWQQGSNLPNSSLHSVSTAGTTSASGYQWGYSIASFLSKADYNYAEKYYASASWRIDGTSRLSPSVRWGNFWSVGASWRINKEEFMKDVSWIDELRLRMTFGTSGTMPSTNYGYMNLMSYTSPYMGNPGGVISSLGNDNLRWETSRTANFGVDFAVLSHRLKGSVEFYNRNSVDLLQDVPISTTTGFGSTLMNVGGINNHGLEIQLDGTIIKRQGLTWDVGWNAALMSSTIRQLYDDADIIWYDPTGKNDRAQFIYREGESTLAFYGYEWAGLDKSNGRSIYYVNGQSDTDGDFLYNGRGATYDYTKANYTIIGDANPFMSGGLNTTVKWEKFDLTANFIYKLGGKFYDAAECDVIDEGFYWERIRSKYYYENMWTEENPNGTEPALSGYDLLDARQFCSKHVHNATFLRLKNIMIGYSLPSNITSKARISSARVYLTANNLFTLSSYKLSDPEVGVYGTRGWECPLPRTYTIGVDVKF